MDIDETTALVIGSIVVGLIITLLIARKIANKEVDEDDIDYYSDAPDYDLL